MGENISQRIVKLILLADLFADIIQSQLIEQFLKKQVAAVE